MIMGCMYRIYVYLFYKKNWKNRQIQIVFYWVFFKQKGKQNEVVKHGPRESLTKTRKWVLFWLEKRSSGAAGQRVPPL